jgi:hypothetical protein
MSCCLRYLQRAASSCERRCPAGCGGGRRPAKCRCVRRRPAGGGEETSDCVGQRGLRPARASAFVWRRRPGASCGRRRPVASGALFGEKLFFLSDR